MLILTRVEDVGKDDRDTNEGDGFRKGFKNDWLKDELKDGKGDGQKSSSEVEEYEMKRKINI